MLVLLVDADRVVVDDAQPLEDGSPPPTLTFQGPDIVGAGAMLHRGPDLVYRLAGRPNLVNAYGRDIVESPLAPASHLAELRALPVYVDAASIAAEVSPAARGEHPSGQRPHLRLAPPVVVDPAAGTVDGVPHFDLGGFAAALCVPGALVEGMRIQLSGFADAAHDGLYDVGPVAEVDGVTVADLEPAGRPGERVQLTAAAWQVRIGDRA